MNNVRTLHTPGQANQAPAESEAPQPKLASVKPGQMPTRRDYAQMNSEDVDATTLAVPVLCKDGWVVPAPL